VLKTLFSHSTEHPALYSGGPGFHFQPRDWLSWV